MRLTIIILLFASLAAKAQFRGNQSVSAPFDARNAALGGRAVSLADGDLMQFIHNPAVLDSVEVSETGVNFSPYFAGIYRFNGAYQGEFGKIGKLAIGLSYLNYGDFQQTAANGDDIGSFQAQDYLVAVGKSHRIGSFTLGSNLKFAYSGAAGYGTSMLLADLGGIYRSPRMDFTVGVVVKNLGVVLDTYSSSSVLEVPFDVQIGASIKPQYMPFRFTLSAHGLAQRDVYFESEANVNNSRSVEFADRMMRKLDVGTELIIRPNIRLLLGYSHLRRQELRLTESANGAGFSYGLMIGIRKIRIKYTHATYHAAGGTDFFTVQTNLNSFRKIL